MELKINYPISDPASRTIGKQAGLASWLSFANVSVRSCCQLLKSVLIMEPTENLSRHDSHAARETVASDRDRWSPKGWT
jgi:hypothetical protein